MSETVVIFRRDATGECFALFPNCPAMTGASSARHTNMSVSTVPPTTIFAFRRSDPAVPAEYADLFEELERRGYDLTVRRRATPDMHERRRRIAAERRLKGQLQGSPA